MIDLTEENKILLAAIIGSIKGNRLVEVLDELLETMNDDDVVKAYKLSKVISKKYGRMNEDKLMKELDKISD